MEILRALAKNLQEVNAEKAPPVRGVDMSDYPNRFVKSYSKEISLLSLCFIVFLFTHPFILCLSIHIDVSYAKKNTEDYERSE